MAPTVKKTLNYLLSLSIENRSELTYLLELNQPKITVKREIFLILETKSNSFYGLKSILDIYHQPRHGNRVSTYEE